MHKIVGGETDAGTGGMVVKMTGENERFLLYVESERRTRCGQILWEWIARRAADQWYIHHRE